MPGPNSKSPGIWSTDVWTRLARVLVNIIARKSKLTDLAMDFVCFNCDVVLYIPEYTDSPGEVCICTNCETDLNLEIYTLCKGCSYYYINTYVYCPYCGKDSREYSDVPEISFTFVKTQEQYAAGIGFINSLDIVGLDTEGNSLDPFANELFLIQLGNEEHVYVFDFTWHKQLAAENFWNDPYKLFIIHNAKFDYKVLKHSLGIELINMFDTFLAERILTCGLERKNSLKDVVEKYLDMKLDKEIRNEFITLSYSTFHQKLTNELIEYSATDVQLLPIIYRKQKWELENADLMKVANLEFEISKVVGEMELKGIYVNRQGWLDIIRECEAKKSEVQVKIYSLLLELGFSQSLFGSIDINLNSTKVLKDIFKKLGIEVASTGDDDLAQIDHPFAGFLREYRKYEKQLSSFGHSFLELVRTETDRVHPSFQQIGADTGRFSCNNPNLQQIPAGEAYRKCFAAPSGKKIIACDYSQQELRLLASLSGDPKFIKFYEDGVDLHTATASMMFNIPMEEVQKDTHRKVAKTINFGLAYGQGAKKLGQTIGVSEEEATKMIEKYFSQFTFIRDWLNNAAKDAQEKGFSKTLTGRKRFYKLPNKNDSDYKQVMSAIGRRGKNTPIQGSGVDMIKMALVLIHNRLREANLDAYLINVVHDEIIVEASEKDAEAAAEIVKNSMIEAGKRLAPNVPIEADAGVGEYWKH
jgi:DNA polymerase-1